MTFEEKWRMLSSDVAMLMTMRSSTGLARALMVSCVRKSLHFERIDNVKKWRQRVNGYRHNVKCQMSNANVNVNVVAAVEGFT